MNKPKEILELEKIYGITLKETLSNEGLVNIPNSYQPSSNRELIGLNLSSNQLTEIKGLENFTHLQELILANNQLAEIKGVEILPQLQKLNLSYNQLTEIKGLENLTQLQKLGLSRNKITEIKGLEKLTQLKSLWLSSNQLTEIKGLKQLIQLQTLYLYNNQISEIKGLGNLTQLQILWLFNNQLKSIAPLKNIIKSLEKLEDLQIYNNPFSEELLLKKEENNLQDIKIYFQILAKPTLPAKFFISYSTTDEEYTQEFIKHTKTMQENGLIDKPFACSNIELGVDWDETIKNALNNCDIMICLISVDFLNSNYIRRIEVVEAMKQDKKLIPIVVRPCDWKSTDFGKYQASLGGKCISLSNNIAECTKVQRDFYWTKIIEEMRTKTFIKAK